MTAEKHTQDAATAAWKLSQHMCHSQIDFLPFVAAADFQTKSEGSGREDYQARSGAA